jgi:ferritin-like metal-binding protein YciE
MDNLRDLLIDELKDLYNAEKQLTKALPRMAKAAGSPKLRDAFVDHLEVTEGQIERLEKIFAELDMPAKSKPCHAMKGIIEEGKEVLDMKKEAHPAVLDAALVAAAQKVEHYEISSYGSCRAHAEALGLKKVAQLLQQTLDEESEANELLNTIAESGLNAAAAGAEEEEKAETE